MLIKPIHTGVTYMLEELAKVLEKSTDEVFVTPLPVLSNASVGEHVRHLIEMFICLQDGYSFGYVDYEKRKRDVCLQTITSRAIEKLHFLGSTLYLEDRALVLLATYDYSDEHQFSYNTTYYRELAYCLEHMIHHMALIKIGLLEMGLTDLPEIFGLAPSTYRMRMLRSLDH